MSEEQITENSEKQHRGNSGYIARKNMEWDNLVQEYGRDALELNFEGNADNFDLRIRTKFPDPDSEEEGEIHENDVILTGLSWDAFRMLTLAMGKGRYRMRRYLELDEIEFSVREK